VLVFYRPHRGAARNRMVELSTLAYYALLEIFILLALAEVVHTLGNRIGLPQIVADLLVGLVVGGYAVGGVINRLIGFSLFDVTNDYVQVFALFSVVLLLFAAGLSAGFSSLRAAGPYAVIAAIAGDLLAFWLSFLVFSRFYPLPAALYIGVACAATSTAVVASLIRSEGIGDTQGAQFLITVAAMDDVVALILLSVVLTIVGGKLDILVVTGTAVEALVAWVVLLLASVIVIPRLLRLRGIREMQDMPLVILFALVAIVVSLGFSAVVGAFIAGLAVAESMVAPRTRQITEVLLAIFGSLFFVVVGAEFDVGLLQNPSLVVLALLLSALAIGGKVLGVYPFARLRLKSAADARAVTLGMIPRGEIALIIGAIGLTAGVLDQQMLGEILLMAILTTLIGAVLFRRDVARIRQRRAIAGSWDTEDEARPDETKAGPGESPSPP
jgi:Kef-type K+ transport system membrane component KefB